MLVILTIKIIISRAINIKGKIYAAKPKSPKSAILSQFHAPPDGINTIAVRSKDTASKTIANICRFASAFDSYLFASLVRDFDSVVFAGLDLDEAFVFDFLAAFILVLLYMYL